MDGITYYFLRHNYPNQGSLKQTITTKFNLDQPILCYWWFQIILVSPLKFLVWQYFFILIFLTCEINFLIMIMRGILVIFACFRFLFKKFVYYELALLLHEQNEFWNIFCFSVIIRFFTFHILVANCELTANLDKFKAWVIWT